LLGSRGPKSNKVTAAKQRENDTRKAKKAKAVTVKEKKDASERGDSGTEDMNDGMLQHP
jgi:hypothetical protein